jgi:hypothetical protein
MILSVADRITLLGVLPEQGDFITLKIVRELREGLSFSEDELRNLSIIQEGNQVRWEAASDPMKDVQIGEKASCVIVDSLKKLNDQKKLTQQHFGLYETFCEK